MAQFQRFQPVVPGPINSRPWGGRALWMCENMAEEGYEYGRQERMTQEGSRCHQGPATSELLHAATTHLLMFSVCPRRTSSLSSQHVSSEGYVLFQVQTRNNTCLPIDTWIKTMKKRDGRGVGVGYVSLCLSI